MNKKIFLIAMLIVLGLFFLVFYDSVINNNPISIAFLILIILFLFIGLIGSILEKYLPNSKITKMSKRILEFIEDIRF